MASILRVNTLTDASSNNSVPMATVSSGSAKAWFHVDTDGASISDSFNISSHDDDGTGDGGIHITNDMGSANYSVLLSCDDAGSTSKIVSLELTRGTQAAGNFDYEGAVVNSSTNRTNVDSMRFGSINGDLA
jgi:hypothetical protein|tara:strand:+ start:758 stop:1153 length:396 start_codon:yes stop_codon:yes gene_type:complete